jgi:hypothetical protein
MVSFFPISPNNFKEVARYAGHVFCDQLVGLHYIM